MGGVGEVRGGVGRGREGGSTKAAAGRVALHDAAVLRRGWGRRGRRWVCATAG